MKIKGAIFDMDGTLVDSLMFWGFLWETIGEKYFNNKKFLPDKEVELNIRTMIYTDAMRYFKEYYGIEGDTESFIRFAEDGIPQFYKDVAKPKAGAYELLDHLREQGIKMVLASATAKKEIVYALDCYKMTEYFDTILSCADIGVGKDKPDIYLDSLSIMGFDCGEVCVFEDSFVALETAKKAGFMTVGIYDKHNPDQNKVKAASDIYLPEGSSLDTLIPLFSHK